VLARHDPARTMVNIGATAQGIGGGEIARDELLAARAAARSVSFIAADLNHRIARDQARAQGRPEPVDFSGAAHAAIAATR
jgi:hypothetical protein